MAMNQSLFDPPKSPICSTCRGTGFVYLKRIVIVAGRSVGYDFSRKCPTCRPAAAEKASES